jgi:hypothetical protein
MAAVAKYSPRTLPVDLLNVIAKGRVVRSRESDTRRTWESLATGAKHFGQVSAADSGQVFVSPHVEELAQLLQQFAAERLSPRARDHDESVTLAQ